MDGDMEQLSQGVVIEGKVQCHYCRILGQETKNATFGVDLREEHPIKQAIKWHAQFDDHQWAFTEQDKTIEKLRHKIELLEAHIKYMPGGEGALEALEHFEDAKKEESMLSK